MILRDPFLMRFVFFGFGDEKRSLELIDEQIKIYQEHLGRRQANLQRWQDGNIYVRLLAELGANMNQMMLDWLEKSREELTADACQEREDVKSV